MKRALIALLMFVSVPAHAADHESVHARVMKAGTIRCGYFVWPPFFAVDANTGAKSGIFYDITEELGRRLELKIDWAQELNFGSYLQDLETGKYDMECTGGWPTATRGKFASYTKAFFYIPLVPFVRADDTRFDGDISKINDSGVKVSVVDGENSQIIRRQQFPASTEVSLPQTATSTEMLMNVATGKADVTFTDLLTGEKFAAGNQGKLKALNAAHPLKMIPQNMTIKPDESRFKDMIDTATEEMLLDGAVNRILKKYENGQALFMRPAVPYEAVK